MPRDLLSVSRELKSMAEAGLRYSTGPYDLERYRRLHEIASELLAAEDREFGGFGAAPKFPTTPALAFLLEHAGARARELSRRTLERMAASPLRDPVEGGFFRYATRRARRPRAAGHCR